MPDNIQRNRGRPNTYKFDRGGQPAEFGPFIGVVKNNVDPTRSGRLEVWIEQFAGSDQDNKSLWRTVSYIPPFYGVTPRNAQTTNQGVGNYEGNQHSYGMWFTPPDLNVQVICFFVAGDPNQGYYIGCVPDPGVNHMIPAIGATRRFETQSASQKEQADFAGTKQLPVVEINADNPAIAENPRFFDQTKPVHKYQFSILFNQGLLADYIRGPISSSSQRESPSSVFGVSTPGRPIYKGGVTDRDIRRRLADNSLRIDDLNVEGRRGGHSIVLDDGDISGQDNLIRIRTAKGHQITMSDEADCFYFIHANGQTWIEMGTEGTVDIYSTNSVNVRTQGELNLHSDKNININAGESLNIRAKNTYIESQDTLKITGINDFLMYSKSRVGIRCDGAINLDCDRAGWRASGPMILRGSRIDLNGPTPDAVTAPKPIVDFRLDDTKFVPGKGWQIEKEKLNTIVTRAPTHEPYPYHNRGVPIQVSLTSSSPAPSKPAVASAIGKTQNIPLAQQAAGTPVTAAINNVADTAAGSAGAAAVGGAAQAAGAATAAAAGAAQAVQSQVTGAAAQVSSLASQAQQGATQALNQTAGSAGKALAVNAADVLSTGLADKSIGNLDRAQVTGLLAQAKTAVGQAADEVSVDKGIGQYGFKPEQLEAGGLIKPGTVQQLSQIDAGAPTQTDIQEAARIVSQGGDITPEQVAQNRKINDFLTSPVAWTGKAGATALDSLLGNPQLQTNVQQDLMSQGLQGLQAAGIATGSESAKDLGALVQSAAKFGVGAVDSFIKGVAPPGVSDAIAGTIKSAQFATDFVTNKLGDLGGLVRSAAAVTNTVDRSQVDSTVNQGLDNPKITPPEFRPLERQEEPTSAFAAQRAEFFAAAQVASDFLDEAYNRINNLVTEGIALQERGNVTTAEVEKFIADRDVVREFYNNNRKAKVQPVIDLAKTSGAFRAEAQSAVDSIDTRIKIILGLGETLKAIRIDLERRVGLGQ